MQNVLNIRSTSHFSKRIPEPLVREQIVVGADEIGRWILVLIAVMIGDPVESLDASAPLSDYDFDSIDAVNMALDLEEKIGLQVHPELFLDGALSVDDIAARLC